MFRKKSVASILASFNKTVDDLTAVAVRCRAKREENTNKILALKDENSVLGSEQIKAERVAEKLVDLLK